MGDGNVLVGHGAHHKDDEGFVDRQAVIVAVVGDAALLEFFDWIMGAPIYRELVPISELANGGWVLYEDAEAMRDRWEQYESHRREASR